MSLNLRAGRAALNVMLHEVRKDGRWLHWEITDILSAAMKHNSSHDLKFVEQYQELHCFIYHDGKDVLLSRTLFEANSNAWVVHDAFGRIEYTQPGTLTELVDAIFRLNERARDCVVKSDLNCQQISIV